MLKWGAETPFKYIKPMDGSVFFASTTTSNPFMIVTPRYKELEKLMKFIGQWQEDYLDTWIRNRWPTQAFSNMGSALWNWRFWGVAFMDSIAATLYTTNECVLKYGLSFTDQQLH